MISTDLSPVMVEAARKRGLPGVEHRVMDMQAIAKLRELESIGVDQFNIYLMTKGQEETLEAYGRDILPQFSGVTA